jgi:hypothetical protein
MDKDKQMSFLFEEGGMADDGLDRDPVSGNEVPSGSMSEEVRDDIPAQLSEGEYVVPADVVRYYGVRFFEDLREDAKEGLTGMEREGRIGGEPVDMEGDDTELTADEMAELESIMGMAVGGYVTDQSTQATDPFEAQTKLYRSPAPVAIGNTMEPRGYQEGGQVTTDFSQFAAGYSFMGPNAGQTMPSVAPVRNVTLYGPNGEVVNLTLPAQQALYDDLISKGYSTQPVSQVQTPTVQTGGSDGGDEDRDTRSATQRRLDNIDDALEKINMDDPLGAGASALEGSTTMGRIAGGVIGSLVLGPLGGLLGGQLGKASQQAGNIAEAAVNAQVARTLGYDTTELDNAITTKMGELSGLSKTFAERAVERATREAAEAIRSVDTPREYALTRDRFQSDDAFATEMQRTAPTGMTYNPATGGYIRTGSAAPTSSPVPTARGVQTTGLTGDRDGDGIPNWRDRDDGVGLFDRSRGQTPTVSAAPTASRAPTPRPSNLGSGSDSGPVTSSSRGSTGARTFSDGTTNVNPNTGRVSSDPNARFNDAGQVAGTGWSGRAADRTSSSSSSGGGGGDSGGGGGGKIVCTAMNASYGFGSYRQAIWLRYSEKNLTKHHEKGYHKIFLPLVDRAYNRGDNNNMLLRKVLENIARHRTADLRAEMQGKKRDTVGRIYRAVLEPICYIVGRLSK